MSDFSDRPFVAGSLIGLRAFAVDKYGRLIGPSFGGVFTPGENEAACHNQSRAVKALSLTGASVDITQMTFSGRALYTVTMPDGSTRQYGSSSALASEFPPPDGDHPIGGADCTCGYYAYFDGGNDYGQPDRVTAVVEGYGVCTVGGRGFRASKARIVGLVAPADGRADGEPEVEAPKWQGLWRRVYPGLTNSALIAVNLGFAAHAALAGDWWWEASFSASCAALIALLWLAAFLSTRRLKRSREELAIAYPTTFSPPLLTDDTWSLVRRNYPDVPIYPTQAAALAAHPLTTPPQPIPEDEDFWTREVPR